MTCGLLVDMAPHADPPMIRQVAALSKMRGLLDQAGHVVVVAHQRHIENQDCQDDGPDKAEVLVQAEEGDSGGR